MILARLYSPLETYLHRRGRCILNPPSWMYDLTFGEWADYTVKPRNAGNLWWRTAQRLDVWVNTRVD